MQQGIHKACMHGCTCYPNTAIVQACQALKRDPTKQTPCTKPGEATTYQQSRHPLHGEGRCQMHRLGIPSQGKVAKTNQQGGCHGRTQSTQSSTSLSQQNKQKPATAGYHAYNVMPIAQSGARSGGPPICRPQLENGVHAKPTLLQSLAATGAQQSSSPTPCLYDPGGSKDNCPTRTK